MPAAHVDAAGPTAGIAWLPLTIALALTLGLTIYPLLLATAGGRADHVAALLAFCSMSAGYVRGVGFVPQPRVLRLAFSTFTCLLTLALAAWRIAGNGIP